MKLVIKHLKKNFDKKEVLKDINFEFEKGKIYGLLGRNGAGKTTLFNALTGSNQHVGNFPGVTVDQKMGSIKGAKNCSVVALPGIYSIRPYTQEEIVSRDFILDGKPDGIINIVDATNIERNLYLTLQLLALNLPMALALKKDEYKYVSISKSSRNIVVEYVRNHESVVTKYYDMTTADPNVIMADAAKLHIDLEYESVPVFINNFNMNMDEYLSFGNVVTPKQFLDKIAEIDVEKL